MKRHGAFPKISQPQPWARGHFSKETICPHSHECGCSRGIAIAIEPQPRVKYRVEFIGTRKGWDTKSEPVLEAPAPDETGVAWTQPVVKGVR